MAPKSRKFKTARRHTRSTAGKILPPLDVRSNKQLKEFERRIKQGGLTFVLVWAPWCGHCHNFMPHFDAAAKSPNRSVQAVKVEETMLPAVNKILTNNVNKSAAPLNVEGYPSIIVVDKNGNKVTDVEAVKSTEVMKNVMENAGPLAKNSGMLTGPSKNAGPLITKNSIPNTTTKLSNIGMTKNIDVGEDELKGSIASVDSKTKVKPLPSSLKKISEEADEVTSLVTPLTPPNSRSDTESILTKKISGVSGGGRGVSGGGRGGSLYASLLRTTYTLAPTAALLASAALVMKKTKRAKKQKKGKTRKGSLRKSVKTRRNRK